jgi:hypothetical protein
VFLDHDRSAHAGAPPQPEERSERPACTENGLAFDRRADVVPDPDGQAEPARQCLGKRERLNPVWEIACVGDGAVRLVDDPRRADPDTRQRARLDSGPLRRLLQCFCDRSGDIRRATVPRRRPASLAGDRVVVVGDDRLDLGAAEVDAASHGRFLSTVFAYDPSLPGS